MQYAFIPNNWKSKDSGRFIAGVLLGLFALIFKLVHSFNKWIYTLLEGVSLSNIYNFLNNFFWVILLIMSLVTLFSVFSKPKYKYLELSENELFLNFVNEKKMVCDIDKSLLEIDRRNGSFHLEFKEYSTDNPKSKIGGGKLVIFYEEDWENFSELTRNLLEKSQNKNY